MVSSEGGNNSDGNNASGKNENFTLILGSDYNTVREDHESINNATSLSENSNNNTLQEIQPIEDSKSTTVSQVAISSLINKYERSSLTLESEKTSKAPILEMDHEKTIKLNNHLYLLINHSLFWLDYTYTKLMTKNTFYSSRDHNEVDEWDLLEKTNSDSMNMLSNVNEDILKILKICQPLDIVRIIVKCEQDNFEANENNYICIIDNRKLGESVFLGITIDSNGEVQIGLVIDYNYIETVEIVGDGCIHLNLKFEHSKSIKISPIQNFWRTLQYLPTWSNQNTYFISDVSEKKLKKSKSYIGLSSSELDFLNPTSLVNRYHSMLTQINRITFLWHNNDYHTSELFRDTLMESNDNLKASKKQLRNLLVDIMTVPNIGDLSLAAIYEQVSQKFDKNIQPFKCFIANETIRIYGKMEMANEILPHLYLGSDFNASDINFLQSHNITHVLNATKEVNNFYIGTLTYFNVNVYDRPESEILPFFNECFRFIENARESGSNILVHCHMGISRSASVVIAYLMKKFKYTFEEAFAYVKKRRSLIRPNTGFIKQLKIYEGMVHNKRLNFESPTPPGTSESTCPPK